MPHKCSDYVTALTSAKFLSYRQKTFLHYFCETSTQTSRLVYNFIFSIFPSFKYDTSNIVVKSKVKSRAT